MSSKWPSLPSSTDGQSEAQWREVNAWDSHNSSSGAVWPLSLLLLSGPNPDLVSGLAHPSLRGAESRGAGTSYSYLIFQMPVHCDLDSPAATQVGPHSRLHCQPSGHRPTLSCLCQPQAWLYVETSLWALPGDRGLGNEQDENAKLTFDSLLASHGQRQGVCGMDDVWPQRLAWLLGVLVVFRPTGTKDWDLAKLSCEIWRALTFVPWAALATVHTWKMANYWKGKETWRGELVSVPKVT